MRVTTLVLVIGASVGLAAGVDFFDWAPPQTRRHPGLVAGYLADCIESGTDPTVCECEASHARNAGGDRIPGTTGLPAVSAGPPERRASYRTSCARGALALGLITD